MLAADKQRPEVDPVALEKFLQFRYTPSPLTIFNGIRKLPPGGMLIAENGTCREERWYSYTPVPFPNEKSERETEDELLSLYRGAVSPPSAQRRAGGNSSQWRTRFRFVARLNGRAKPRLAGIHGWLRQEFRRRRVRGRRRNSVSSGSSPCSSALGSRRIRTIVAQDRRLSRGTNRILVNRSDVPRVSASTAGCKGGPGRSGAG